MTIDALWTGWRSKYLSSLPSPFEGSHSSGNSIFTQILESGLTDEETYIVHRGEYVLAILNAYPYAVGHLMVLPVRQIANLSDLTPHESTELWSTVTAASEVLKSEYGPHGLNVGINLGPAAGGSVSEHLHVHIVPRWRGDANFMTSVANAKTISEPLNETAHRIRRAWTKYGSSS
jgi:ATP adenylyltransferase